jgi:WD40 repeat protein
VIPRYTDNDTVRILDMETFESLHTIRVDGADIGSVGFSPDNRALIIDDESSYTIQVVDIESGDVTSRMEGHSDSITAFALTEDRLFTASRDLTVRMWDAETGSELDTLRQFTDSDPQIDVSNEYVALTNYGDSSIQLWRINAGENGDGVGTEIGHEVEKTLLGHTDYIFDLGFSADGSRLVTSSSDSTVRVWDVSTGETLFVLEHPDDVYGAGLNSDGSLIATGATDNLVRLWDGETGELITELEGHVSAVNRVVFSPDDKYLLSTGTDTYVYLWDLATNEAVLEERGADGEILAAAFNRDGSQFVTGGADMKLRIWNTAEGDYEPVLRGHTDVIWAAAFSADGALLASSGDDDTLRLWDVASHKMIAQIKPGVFGNIGSIGFNGDSTRLFASVSGSGVFVYATSEVGEPLPSSTLEFSDPYPVEGLKVESTETLDVPYIGAVLSPDGERFVLIGEDSLCVYTVENTADELAPQQCTTIEYAISPQSVRWSPDSTQIAYTESFRPDFIEQDIWVLNAETGEARNLTDDGAAGEVTMSNMANVNYDAFPTWSADGQLYFVRFVQGIGDVYTIDPNEPEGEPQYVGITNTSSFEFSGMIWTPHGLVFSSLRPPYGAELTATVWLMDLGDEVGELTPLSMAGESYVSEVSADGNFVLVLNTSVSAGGTPSATTTTIVAVDGSMEIPADKDARAQVGMWSPEGAGLLYLTSTNLYGIGAPGADSVEIERGNYTSPLHAARAPIWAANNVILLRDAVEGTLVVVRLEGE